MATKKEEERGSYKLIEERFGVKAYISEEEIVALLTILEKHGIELGNIIIRGTPWPVWLAGTAKAPTDQAADLILSLVGLRYQCQVSPYGLPAVEGVLVNFANNAELGG